MNEGRQRRTGLDRRQVIGIAAVVGYLALLMGLALLTYLGDLPQSDYIPIPPLTISVQWGLKGGVLAVACWLALGDGHWLVRLATCVLALVWISIGWLAALKMARFEGPPIGSWGFYPLLHIPYLFVPTAVVLASARAAWGLRFVSDFPQPLVAAPRQFTLSQVLLAVAGCAATLAVMRAVAPPDRQGLHWWRQTDFHQNAAIWCLVEAATSVPTALVFVFRRRWWLVAGGHCLLSAGGYRWHASPATYLGWSERLATAGLLRNGYDGARADFSGCFDLALRRPALDGLSIAAVVHCRRSV